MRVINKGYIAKSKIHGYGVFAKQKIREGELVEQAIVPEQVISPEYEFLDGKAFIKNVETMSNYRFAAPGLDQNRYWVIPAGNAIMYNHSFNPNMVWQYKRTERIIEFIATRNIEPNEELLFDYGPQYKYHRRTKISNEVPR
jgi:SET domain-containing protein